MRCILLLCLLLPSLGGCLASPSVTAPLSPPPPPSASAVPEDFSASSAPGEKRPLFLSLLDGDELVSLADPELEEELTDPETLADNFLLSGAGETPPDDEGETVTADDEVTFDFPVVENEKVHYYIDYFTGPARQTFTRWLERSGRYLPYMQEIFAEEGLPLDLTYLAMVESGFNNRAYSWAHAAGPWQFISSTGRIYGMNSDWWRDERRDFEKATRAAARFLKHLHAKFDGDWYLAIASYNAGPGKLQRAIEKYGTRDFWEISRGPYLANETKNYVPKLLAVLLIAKQLEKYGFSDLQLMEPVSFEVVELPTATDLEIVAKYCEVSYEDIKDLNPELKRWCTPPSLRNYPLRIPAGKKEQFEKQFSLLPSEQRANYLRHQVKKGDSLGVLARRYDIRVEDIMAMNRITNPRLLRVGADLILPLRKGTSPLPLKELGDDKPLFRQKTYTVRKGDSLWKIGQKFGVTEKELRSWNRISAGKNIYPGQVLTVAAGRPQPAAKTGVKAEGGRKTTHEVTSGDSLWKIARQYGVSQDQLRSWNQLARNHVLQPGDKLNIFAQADPARANLRRIVYQVQPGDSFWQISRRFDVATSEILKWNDLTETHILRPGDKLTLLVGEGKQG